METGYTQELNWGSLLPLYREHVINWDDGSPNQFGEPPSIVSQRVLTANATK